MYFFLNQMWVMLAAPVRPESTTLWGSRMAPSIACTNRAMTAPTIAGASVEKAKWSSGTKMTKIT